jgi:hypothetical protein
VEKRIQGVKAMIKTLTCAIVSALSLFPSVCCQEKPAPDAVLAVEGIMLEPPDRVHYQLHNVSDKPITAFTLAITAEIDGISQESISGTDLLPGLWLEGHPLYSSVSGRPIGSLKPGDSFGGASTLNLKNPEAYSTGDVSIQVLSVIFSDVSHTGDPVYFKGMLKGRQKRQEDLAEAIRLLQVLDSPSDPLTKMRQLKEMLSQELNWPDEGPQPQFVYPEQEVKLILLEELRNALRTIDHAGFSADRAYFELNDRLQLKHDSYLQHSRVQETAEKGQE